ncbi:MAG: CaiB/BaiF CoA-transferase family protein [Pseudomonadota bacterium]
MPALTGLRILDLTQWESGTSCTQSLALMGADVVKIEPPGQGDPGRNVKQDFAEGSEYFFNWNSNKRSVELNLREPRGRDILLQLAPKFDVFVENFGPGVVEKLDIGYEVIKSVNPEIIYAQIKGFGLSGPYANYKCFDMVAQAAAGALSVTGEPDGPPMRPGPTIGDSGAGLQMALAITGAYVQKLKEGKGQRIELSMQESATYFMRTMIAFGSHNGTKAAPRLGNDLDPTISLFACKPFGPNDYVYVMVVMPQHWPLFCEAMGQSELATDDRFKDLKARRENAGALKSIIDEWMAQHTKHEAMATLAGAGIPASAVLDTKDLFQDPHLNAREFVHQLPRGDDHITLLGWPARMSESAVPMQLAPELGAHTHEVLQNELGLSDHDLASLRTDGILGS